MASSFFKTSFRRSVLFPRRLQQQQKICFSGNIEEENRSERLKGLMMEKSGIKGGVYLFKAEATRKAMNNLVLKFCDTNSSVFNYLENLPYSERKCRWGLRGVRDQRDAVIVEPLNHATMPRRKILELCEKCIGKKGLLVFDEVDVGLHLTGKLFAHEAISFKPKPYVLVVSFPYLHPGALVISERIQKNLSPEALLGDDDIVDDNVYNNAINVFQGTHGLHNIRRDVYERMVHEVVKRKPGVQMWKCYEFMVGIHTRNLTAAAKVVEGLRGEAIELRAVNNELRYLPPLDGNQQVVREHLEVIMKKLRVI